VQKTSQINIRFDPETEQQLNAVAEELGVSKSALVRRLTEKFLMEVKRIGAVNLNPEWIKEIGRADARAKWGERKIVDLSGAMVAENENREGDAQTSRRPVKYPRKKGQRK
jgi:predicted DNA-binding protein